MAQIKKRTPSNQTTIIYDGDIMVIPPEIHAEYIEYHKKVNLDTYDYEKVIKESNQLLFDLKDTSRKQQKITVFARSFCNR